LNVDIAIKDPLQVLAEEIRAKNLATYIEVISAAKIPIVKFDHISGVSVDIVINNSDGIATAKLMKKYVREFPPLKPLTVLLKVFLVENSTLFILTSISPNGSSMKLIPAALDHLFCVFSLYHFYK
jgi:hypothetical protein